MSGGTLSSRAVNTRVNIRMIRQQILERDEPPLSLFVLDEAAIRRLSGEESVFRDQAAKLLSLTSRPNITIELIPFNVGLYKGMIEPFAVLEFSDETDSDVLYLEGHRDSMLSRENAGDIIVYRTRFEQLRKISLGREATVAYLREISKKIR
jgi:hypothetical protein